MRTRSHYFFFILSSLLLLSNVSLAAEYIIKLKNQDHFRSDFLSMASDFKASLVDQHDAGKLVLVSLPDENEDNFLLEAKGNSSIEYVVENIQLKTFATPLTNDPKINEQWALKKVDAEAAWEHTTGDSEIVVAVIDTGVNWSHEDLQEQIWTNPFEKAGNGIDDDNNGFIDDVRGWDFAAGDNDPDDETSSQNPGHGTHCAGIVGAKGNNQTGISGMAQNVSIMPVRFLDAKGSGDLMNGVKSIDYAIANGADIISASWGAAVARDQMAPVLEAIERANAKDILFIAAAANDGKSNDFREVYPANAGFKNVISVAASGPQDAKPSWSNFGRVKVDVAAPGENIESTLPGGYGPLSGTSMATPLVSGLAALVLSYAKELNKELSPTDVKNLLSATSDPVSIETASGGRVNAGKALAALKEGKLLLTPFAATLGVSETVQLGAMNAGENLEFAVSDESLATVSAEGVLTAKADGQVEVLIKDDTGAEFSSDRFFIGKEDAPASSCPLEDPTMCQVLCSINPTFPWCQ